MATYIFRVRDNKGTISYGADQVQNWSEIESNLTRDQFYKGVVRTFTNSFELVDEFKERVLELKDEYQGSAEMYMQIFVGNNNKERSSFKPLGNGQEYKADLMSCDIEADVFLLNFLDTSFEEKLFSRDGKKVNFNTPTSIDGEAISDYTALLNTGILHDRTLFFNSESELKGTEDEGTYTIPITDPVEPGDDTFFALPVFTTKKDDANFKDVSATPSKNSDSPDLFFYLISDKSRTVNLNFNFNFNLIMTYSIGDVPVSLRYRKVDDQFNTITSTIIDSHIYRNIGDSYNFTFNDNFNEYLQEGDSLQFYLQIGAFAIFPDPTFDLKYTQQNNIICESKEYFTATTSNIILPHDLGSRLSEIYTGQSNFYSTLFGTTGLGYAEDGEWAYLASLNGKMIRGFDFTLNPLNTSLKDAFQAWNAIEPLGATIELIGGQPRLRIEKLSFFFDPSNELDLGNVVSSVKRLDNKDYQFTEINCGYKDQEYEEVNGLESYNGAFTFAAPLKIKPKKYNIESKSRTDDIGIELTRRKQFNISSTEDYRTDKNNFLIDFKKTINGIEAVRAEDFSIVNGILEPQAAYNLRITPKRNLLRHGYIVTSCLTGNNNDQLIYVKGANNAELQTQLITESELLIEKANVDISSLDNPIWLAELLELEVPFTKLQWDDLMLNKNKMLKFTYKDDVFRLFIDDFKYNIDEEKAIITGLRANR